MKSLKIEIDFDLDYRGDYSFMNFSSLGNFMNGEYDASDIRFMCDGMLSALLISILKRKRIDRFSFDFTSLAGVVFDNACRESKKLFFVGGNKDEIKSFVGKINSRYPSVIVAGFSDGYVEESLWSELYRDIVNSEADIVVAGLGAGKQERFLNGLRRFGYRGTGYTCGGFISQTAMSSNEVYYPVLVDKFNLRFLYRMYREPHTIRRYFIDYPVNLVLFIKRYFVKDVVIDLVGKE